MRRVITHWGLLAAMLTPTMAHAWDVEEGVPGASLTGYLPQSVTLASLDIVLTGPLVTLAYRGTNKTNAFSPIVLTSFVSAFNWQGVAADYPDRQMPELTLKVNGRLIKDKPRAQAMFNGDDVTAQLKRAGIDPRLVAKGEDALIASPAHGVKRFFSNTGEASFPLWHLLYRHVWTIPTLDQGALTFEIKHQVRPAKAEVALSSRQFEGAVVSHCGDIHAVTDILKGAHGSLPNSVVIETITIPLQFANSASFEAHLTIQDRGSSTGLPVAVVLACGADESSLMGQPFIQSAALPSGTTLSVLRILLQS